MSDQTALQVGSLVVARRACGVCDAGERGVVYETYELGDRPGWSVIFESGRHDGFSPDDVAFFLTATGDVCEELTDYVFRNIPHLVDDFQRGAFDAAFGPEARRAILNRWFSTEARGGGEA